MHVFGWPGEIGSLTQMGLELYHGRCIGLETLEWNGVLWGCMLLLF